MKVFILDYNACNLASVYNAFYRLGADVKIIKNKSEITKADKLVVPGVGAAKSAIEYLHKKDLFDSIIKFYDSGKPIMGICLGFQIFSKNLFEDGFSKGLGNLNGEVIEFSEKDGAQKFHIGWNYVNLNNNLKKFFNIQNKLFYYFCHSYFLNLSSKENIDYGTSLFQIEFPSIILKKNFLGTQFHPEKSQRNGEKIFEKFIGWKP